MKKVISFALAAIIFASCLALASCGKSEDGVPNGMKKASSDAASYIFYVPEVWQCDVASGATTAYYSNSDTSSVSVMTFSLENSDATADDWWEGFEDDFKKVYDDFSIESREDTKLDGEDAVKYVFSGSLSHGEEEKVEFKFMQIASVKRKPLSAPEVYVITYTSSPDVYEEHLSDVQKMIDNFKFN